MASGLALGMVIVWFLGKNTSLSQCLFPSRRMDGPGGGGGTPLFGLYGDVPLDRVWFFGLSGCSVLNRICNLTCLCPKQGQNLS